ncbi:MAG: type II/IV secretion system protein [Candidatus Colwellbacteria bacterium]|nr:type II/IV secretion system protein [Candidatus Colwellbacteria bacterium]
MLQIPEQDLLEVLTREGLVTPAQFEKYKTEAARLGQDIADMLVSAGIMSEDYYNNLLSRHFEIPFANLDVRGIDQEVLNLIPEPVARGKRAVPFAREKDDYIAIAMHDPSDLAAVSFLEKYIKARIRPYFASDSDLNKGFAMYSKETVEDYRKIIEQNIAESVQRRITGEKAATDVPIVEIINNILSYAMSLRASDVHIEILEDTVLVRYRIDGILHEMFKVPKVIFPALLARVKLLGGLKIDEHYKPQDGRLRYKIGSDIVDIRVAIIPTFYGEKVEMRLLPASTKPLSFTELGMLPETVKVFEENVKKPYGMALVCGPTGAGKSTTLYSALNILNKPEVNIVTIEDPIEYDIRFINQTQVNAAQGITFATGLKAILRQDPNVIMVGEIRDVETADISVQSALTGHMVLSSLHTNDAATAVPRLLDMKILPFLVAAVVNVVLAQRLVRKICRSCIYSYQPNEGAMKAIKEQSALFGSPNVKLPKLLFKGKGCAACGHSGYRGRMGIFEVLSVSEKVRALIVSPEFSLDSLQALARKEGMETMFEDGMKKVELGMTTIEELLRVIRE